MKRLMSLAIVALPLVGVSAAPASASDVFEKIKVEAGQTLYDRSCRRCHAVDSTDPSYGPPLENILYRAAGTYEDYDYSIAMEASGIVWTPGAVRAWMEDNDGFMPGTKMRHVGIEDRTVQDFILAYLGSISPQDNKEISK